MQAEEADNALCSHGPVNGSVYRNNLVLVY